jgi:hypothetical protein
MKKSKPIIGRDPTKGILSFKTGVIRNRKDRLKNRKDKFSKREKRRQMNGE